MAATRALIVEDNALNRRLLVGQLEAMGYETAVAHDGVEGWDILSREGQRFDVVLLDRRMPNMDGMEVLARIKASPTLQALPVIMQTAADSQQEIIEGIKAGVYYYLTKPFEPAVLLSVTASAVADYARYRSLQRDVDQRTQGLGLMHEGTFRFRTVREGRDLSVILASAMPHPQRAVIGLSELMINAVEHGNLGITYDEKSVLLKERRMEQEMVDRLARPEYRAKLVEVAFERHADRLMVTITDEGEGFDWQRYMEMDPTRVFDTHGRGIALAHDLSFDALEYRGRGNQVVATVMVGRAPVKDETAGETTAPVSLGDLSEGVSNDMRLSAMHARLRDTRQDLEAFKARLAQDLTAAREMQQDLLPPPQLLTDLQARFQVRLDSHFETSSELGGDLFGLRGLDEHRIALWMVDFSGHGVSAALNTFRLHTLLEDMVDGMDQPGVFLTRLNNRLSGLLSTGQYATALYGVVDLEADCLTYAAAAAPSPLFVSLADGTVTAGLGAGLPLGVMSGVDYDTRTAPFPRGSLLFLYSDALLECGRETGDDLGKQGVRRLLSESAVAQGEGFTLARFLEPFFAKVSRPLSDDLTALACLRPADAAA
ncbi:SpoIIE family protein phosphatase [Roseospira visakhapatnamensis]|uniref:CheY-like chemotaxis protein n=1 Tax=Roseospira visakhapatnamensis TaxID=390880 RepID=A0A7W6WA57_9PROT|nr:SpoIIE family protein phosphatase [Roseospira visakhapatnamensis]MBB4266855.1 CheY-like chemotaxis protein [Roseospira visakhapatnamensis]